MTYSINENGETILENYNEAKPFSSFFPGIAGLFGIPMWVFFVNRGQCISSFGVESKDKAILEFYPANKSYRFTPLTGFRTFLKITTDDKTFFYEPFQNCLENTRFQCENRMTFSPVFLKLEEFNPILSVKVTVTYITIPNEPFPALARKIEIENTGKQPISIEMIDGIPAINAFGLESWIQKFMCRTGEAWVEVQNLENCAPLYKVKVVIADKPEVEYVHRGHFSLYFDEQGKLLQPIVDPQAVFGQNTGICFPEKWFSVTPYEVPTFQTKENFTPCAMTLYSSTLDQRETRTVCGIFGHVKNLESLNRIAGAFASGKIQNHSRSMTPMAWFEDKLNQNIRLIRELQNNMTTFSASHLFDHYCSMTYLDNVLRGGIPVIPSGTDSSDHLFHVYSRKHGDLERDYNYFYVQPTYLSQGNGNFRDVNQNRRNDIWFNPSMLEANIRTFYNLIQLDGYNPLVLKGAVFILKKFTDKLESELISCLQKSQDWVKLKKMLEKPFAPGQLLSATIMDEDIAFKVSPEKFLSILLPHTKRIDTADFGEGYWSDHWTYNLDQVESYLTLFPEKKEELLFQNKTFTFHQGYVQVNPRKTRYILRNGNPFQTQNLREDHDKMKKHSNTDAVARTEYGKGDVYHACLYSKMLCLVACKMATLDPNGSGIEMEGGRPNWYDALNGLPGLFGSSTHETLELKRLVMFMLGACKEKLFTSVRVPKELAVFIRTVAKLLKKNLKNTENDPFLFWDESNTAKEKYRNAIRDGIHGEEKEFSCSFIKNF
ncbi:MAG: hypothetical protein JW774_01510, partial [Candidatus Aureabacteria bacterium]|nr:hypothetical protein [Candidatus Auribacterota bacterium]